MMAENLSCDSVDTLNSEIPLKKRKATRQDNSEFHATSYLDTKLLELKKKRYFRPVPLLGGISPEVQESEKQTVNPEYVFNDLDQRKDCFGVIDTSPIEEKDERTPIYDDNDAMDLSPHNAKDCLPYQVSDLSQNQVRDISPNDSINLSLKGTHTSNSSNSEFPSYESETVFTSGKLRKPSEFFSSSQPSTGKINKDLSDISLETGWNDEVKREVELMIKQIQSSPDKSDNENVSSNCLGLESTSCKPLTEDVKRVVDLTVTKPQQPPDASDEKDPLVDLELASSSAGTLKEQLIRVRNFMVNYSRLPTSNSDNVRDSRTNADSPLDFSSVLTDLRESAEEVKTSSKDSLPRMDGKNLWNKADTKLEDASNSDYQTDSVQKSQNRPGLETKSGAISKKEKSDKTRSWSMAYLQNESSTIKSVSNENVRSPYVTVYNYFGNKEGTDDSFPLPKRLSNNRNRFEYNMEEPYSRQYKKEERIAEKMVECSDSRGYSSYNLLKPRFKRNLCSDLSEIPDWQKDTSTNSACAVSVERDGNERPSYRHEYYTSSVSKEPGTSKQSSESLWCLRNFEKSKPKYNSISTDRETGVLCERSSAQAVYSASSTKDIPGASNSKFETVWKDPYTVITNLSTDKHKNRSVNIENSSGKEEPSTSKGLLGANWGGLNIQKDQPKFLTNFGIDKQYNSSENSMYSSLIKEDPKSMLDAVLDDLYRHKDKHKDKYLAISNFNTDKHTHGSNSSSIQRLYPGHEKEVDSSMLDRLWDSDETDEDASFLPMFSSKEQPSTSTSKFEPISGEECKGKDRPDEAAYTDDWEPACLRSGKAPSLCLWDVEYSGSDKHSYLTNNYSTKEKTEHSKTVKKEDYKTKIHSGKPKALFELLHSSQSRKEDIHPDVDRLEADGNAGLSECEAPENLANKIDEESSEMLSLNDLLFDNLLKSLRKDKFALEDKEPMCSSRNFTIKTANSASSPGEPSTSKNSPPFDSLYRPRYLLNKKFQSEDTHPDRGFLGWANNKKEENPKEKKVDKKAKFEDITDSESESLNEVASNLPRVGKYESASPYINSLDVINLLDEDDENVVEVVDSGCEDVEVIAVVSPTKEMNANVDIKPKSFSRGKRIFEESDTLDTVDNVLARLTERLRQASGFCDTNASTSGVRDRHRKKRNRLWRPPARKEEDTDDDDILPSSPQSIISLSSVDEDIGEVQIIDDDNPSASPLSPSKKKKVSNKLTESESKAETKSKHECAICLEIMNGKRGTSSTFCGHVYCTPCIEDVVEKRGECPTCRKPLTATMVHKLFLF